MLARAWLFLGLIAAALEMGAFFYVLLRAGWHPGDPVGKGDPLHHAYLQATTMTFLSMVVAQIGTAFASRTERASLRSIGVFSNRMLLWGIAFELILAAVLVYTPLFNELLGTAALPARDLLILLPFPFIVWGADELRRYLVRRAEATPIAKRHPRLHLLLAFAWAARYPAGRRMGRPISKEQSMTNRRAKIAAGATVLGLGALGGVALGTNHGVPVATQRLAAGTGSAPVVTSASGATATPVSQPIALRTVRAPGPR